MKAKFFLAATLVLALIAGSISANASSLNSTTGLGKTATASHAPMHHHHRRHHHHHHMMKH